MFVLVKVHTLLADQRLSTTSVYTSHHRNNKPTRRKRASVLARRDLLNLTHTLKPRSTIRFSRTTRKDLNTHTIDWLPWQQTWSYDSLTVDRDLNWIPYCAALWSENLLMAMCLSFIHHISGLRGVAWAQSTN